MTTVLPDALLHRDVASASAAVFVVARRRLPAPRWHRAGVRSSARRVRGRSRAAGARLADQLRTGTLLGVWERWWLAIKTLLPLDVAGRATAGSRRRPSPSVLARGTAVAGVVAMLALLALAISAQPAFDLRNDLVSALAARGSAAPLLGQLVIAALALSHAATGWALLLRQLRVAGTAALLAAGCLLTIALVQITCPRGARGCSGPDSGRPSVKPLDDVVHRNLVVAFELASVALAASVALHLIRAGRTTSGSALLGTAGLSPLLLWQQQAGLDIGWWQLSWLVVTSVILLACVTATRRPRPPACAPARAWQHVDR